MITRKWLHESRQTSSLQYTGRDKTVAEIARLQALYDTLAVASRPNTAIILTAHNASTLKNLVCEEVDRLVDGVIDDAPDSSLDSDTDGYANLIPPSDTNNT